jgi:hypothetical protein
MERRGKGAAEQNVVLRGALSRRRDRRLASAAAVSV